jgi:hypothetical protein
VLVVCAVLLTAGCATGYQWTSYPPGDRLAALSAEQWQEDVAFLRSELPRRNPHLRTDPELGARFDARARELADAALAGADANEIVTGIAQLLATLGEGHTAINASPEVIFPIRVHWLADGLYVVRADREYESALGGRVIGVKTAQGSIVGVRELESTLNTVISADHPNGYRLAHGQVVQNPYLMRGLDLADRDGLRLVIRTDEGEATVLVAERRYSEVDAVSLAEQREHAPLSARDPGRNWWTRTGTDNEIVYLSYDSCRMDAYDLFRDVLAELAHDDVSRLIVDLRENSGGISLPGTWFANQLTDVEKLKAPGAIFVLIGPRTFSSGMMMAVDLMAKTDAVFAGEPLAESPTSWGEVKRFPLPNSGLMIGHSTRLVRYGGGKNLRLDDDGNIVPDPGFQIVQSIDEFMRGVDPVFEAAVAAKPPRR